jgi:hypothetical protein
MHIFESSAHSETATAAPPSRAPANARSEHIRAAQNMSPHRSGTMRRVLALALSAASAAARNSLARTPPMGWMVRFMQAS